MIIPPYATKLTCEIAMGVKNPSINPDRRIPKNRGPQPGKPHGGAQSKRAAAKLNVRITDFNIMMKTVASDKREGYTCPGSYNLGQH